MNNRILLFLLGLFFLIFMVRNLIRKETALENQIHHVLKTKPKVISIGSSHARTLLPLQNSDFYVIHESGIDLSEIILILNKITAEYEPESIIICISDYHGYLLNRFYSTEKENRVDKFENVLYSINSFSFSFLHSSITAWFRPFLFFEPQLISTEDELAELPNQLFVNTALKKLNQRKTQINQMQQLGFDTETFILNEVEQWVKSTSKTKLIFYTPPFHQSLQTEWIENQTKKFYSSLKQNLNPYSNRILFYNNQFNTELTKSDVHFLNSDHLNESGKKTYIESMQVFSR